MRRAVLALAATAAGLALLLSFKTTPLGSPGPPGAGHPVTGHAVSGPAGGRRDVTGPAVPTLFGPVQVRVSLAHGHITGVQALLMPHDFALSQQISAHAGPVLRREVLHAQSAHINTVSGATYTSAGYRQSLQAALDKASA
jgi:hypothetical protein